MYNSKFKYYAIGLICLSLLFYSCGKKPNSAESSQKNTTHSISATKTEWYSFSTNPVTTNVDIVRVDFPVSLKQKKPWTEKVFIASVGLMYNAPIFLVNRVGILKFTDDDLFTPELVEFDEMRYRTAEGFYSTDDGSLIKLYTNSVFAGNSRLSNGEQPFICRFNPVSEKLIPLYFPKNLGLPEYAQCTSIERVGNSWFSSFKIENGNNIDFAYFKFKKMNAISTRNVNSISKEIFQNSLYPIKITAGKQYRDKISNLLSKVLSQSLDQTNVSKIEVICISNSLPFKKKFIFSGDTGNGKTINAYAVYHDDGKVEILLDSGELFIAFNKSESELKIEKLELPTLPKNFFYSYFLIKDKVIIAGWEESSFFEIGSTGFLKFDITK